MGRLGYWWVWWHGGYESVFIVGKLIGFGSVFSECYVVCESGYRCGWEWGVSAFVIYKNYKKIALKYIDS